MSTEDPRHYSSAPFDHQKVFCACYRCASLTPQALPTNGTADATAPASASLTGVTVEADSHLVSSSQCQLPWRSIEELPAEFLTGLQPGGLPAAPDGLVSACSTGASGSFLQEAGVDLYPGATGTCLLTKGTPADVAHSGSPSGAEHRAAALASPEALPLDASATAGTADDVGIGWLGAGDHTCHTVPAAGNSTGTWEEGSKGSPWVKGVHMFVLCGRG